MRWYDNTARKLPWRVRDDPYAVLVSEFMLQQTQAARVIDRFERFLHRFPDVVALGAAPAGAVIEEWRGLGYNRRAVALHRTAQRIVAEHSGRVPADPSVLEGLPGIGPYTARAIGVFGFGHRVAPVDVNIARVLSRAVVGHPLTRAGAQAAADDEIAPRNPAARRPAVWSQALMDLGATCCRSRGPACTSCPISVDCVWRQQQPGEPDPARASAIRSRAQAPFAGSDRQYRGRLLDAVRKGPVPVQSVAEVLGLRADPARAERLVRALTSDGLICYSGQDLRLP